MRIGEAQKLAQGLPAEGPVEPRIGPQGPQLQPEDQGPTHPTVVERFLPQAVTGQGQHPPLPVPHRQREHPDTAPQGRLDPPGIAGGEQGLGIRMAPPGRRPARPTLERLPQFQMVVDLPVENDDKAAEGPKSRQSRTSTSA